MTLGQGSLDTLMRSCEGDMRKAVGFLQSAHDLSGGGNTEVTVQMIEDVCGQVNGVCINRITFLIHDFLSKDPI